MIDITSNRYPQLSLAIDDRDEVCDRLNWCSTISQTMDFELKFWEIMELGDVKVGLVHTAWPNRIRDVDSFRECASGWH
jgi:hypothetical protein